MGEALFIITNVSQSTREEELQRSDIRSHVSKINWRRRKAFFRPKWELNASFPRIPTGSNIGMPWVPGELNLNVLNPGTRDMALIEHIVAYRKSRPLSNTTLTNLQNRSKSFPFTHASHTHLT